VTPPAPLATTGRKRSAALTPNGNGSSPDRPGAKTPGARLDTNPSGSYLLGYARVSRVEQNLDRQHDALTAAGCWRVWSEKQSGARDDRPALVELLGQLRPGDVLVVQALDRLGRSLQHLISVVQEIEERGAGLRVLSQGIDTTTATGKLMFHVFGALAEFEREMLRERTLAGLAAARARGRIGGRPRVMDKAKVRRARELLKAGGMNLDEAAGAVGVSRRTLSRYLTAERGRQT
jgi:DNA invertase Pin-like site-specific DNA recombinase